MEPQGWVNTQQNLLDFSWMKSLLTMVHMTSETITLCKHMMSETTALCEHRVVSNEALWCRKSFVSRSKQGQSTSLNILVLGLPNNVIGFVSHQRLLKSGIKPELEDPEGTQ